MIGILASADLSHGMKIAEETHASQFKLPRDVEIFNPHL